MQEMPEMQVRSLGLEDPLEQEKATHSSILAWKIPWTERPGDLESVELQSQAWLRTHADYFTSWFISIVWLQVIYENFFCK